MARVVVIGGGVAGCSAAITAAQTGVETLLLERMDTLSGMGLWTGQLLSWIARQETKLMGGGAGQVISLMESLALHYKDEMGVPDGHLTFDVAFLDAGMKRLVERAGVKLLLRSRAVDVERRGNRIEAVVLADGTRVAGDAFVDATGNVGGMDICEQYGQGCVLCIMKCPIFGDRVAISEAGGIPAIQGTELRPYLSCYLIYTPSFSPEVRHRIEHSPNGYYYHPIPEELQRYDFTHEWRRPEQPVTTVLKASHLQIAHINWSKTWLNVPLKFLRSVPGFENVWVLNPGVIAGQAVQRTYPAPHDLALQVTGLENLFAAGLRSGRFSAFVEVMYTGDLAGYNAARRALNTNSLLEIPTTTTMGYFLKEVGRDRTICDYPDGAVNDPRFDPYRERGLDTTDPARIRRRMDEAGLLGIYQKPLT
ncbi:MAG: FAD-dependent oxidoreductase [Chloroflexi bacterium]|nr:FAD-dependent oxidoreductase [Chloroflexota bacterium]